MATATVLRNRFRAIIAPRRLLDRLSKGYLRRGESLDEFKGGWVEGLVFKSPLLLGLTRKSLAKAF